MKRTVLIYSVLVLLGGLAMYVVFGLGGHSVHSVVSDPSPVAANLGASTSPAASTSIWSALGENIKTPLGRLLLQFIVILASARALGAIFRKMGQPAVMGEMTAGILLGPSLLGWLYPDAFNFIFPKNSLGTLQLLSQVGVCLFMFVIGMELDLGHLRRKAQTAIVISHASIVFPYLLGIVLSLFLYADYAGTGSSFTAFALFMGIAMSLTAFPVLVRILEDRGIAKTFLGSMATTCAAAGDATAWGVLACVVAIVRATGVAATVFNLSLVLAFLAVMLWFIRPRLADWLRLGRLNGEAGRRNVVAVVLILMTASALVTETIGIHALFGAFLAGVVMPRREKFLEHVVVRVENVSRLFLLPLFFAFSGLRTHIGLLGDATGWLACVAIILVATLGKGGGTLVSARLMGLKWNEAFSLAALMNTRGLVELVALNIGYDLGILSPAIFAMMVLMALVTTFLAVPLLSLAERVTRRTVVAIEGQAVSNV
jgi:Kef-type K+ transport system membrane component KefB